MKETQYFTTEIRITFTGETSVDEEGNRIELDQISNIAAQFVSAAKKMYPAMKIGAEQNTTTSHQPIEVEVKSKKT